MPKLNVDGLNFQYTQSGSGPDVVLVHAFTANSAVWMFINIIETLAADFRVTVYDLRGHGNSDVPATGYTSADMARDFQKLHAALELGPAYVVGHSFGGVVGMHAAVEYPELVRGVVLSDTYFPGLAHIEPNMAEALVWQDVRETLRAVGEELSERVNFRQLFDIMGRLNPEQMQTIKDRMGAPGARWLAQLGQLRETSAAEDTFETAGLTEERLRSIEQPVVALYDEHSPFKATCQFLEHELPHCTVDVVPGANHLAPLQSSQDFVRLVQKHLLAMEAERKHLA